MRLRLLQMSDAFFCYCLLSGLLFVAQATAQQNGIPDNLLISSRRIRHSHLHTHGRRVEPREVRAKPLVNPKKDAAEDGREHRTNRTSNAPMYGDGGSSSDAKDYRTDVATNNRGGGGGGSRSSSRAHDVNSSDRVYQRIDEGSDSEQGHTPYSEHRINGGKTISLSLNHLDEPSMQSQFTVAGPSLSAVTPPALHEHGMADDPAGHGADHGSFNHTILFGTPISPVGHQVAWCHDESTDHEHAGGVSIASIRWEFVSVPFMFTAFVILAGLTKIIFHHANFLSSIIPESCMLIVLGTLVGGIAHISNNDTLPAFSPDTFFLYLLPPIVLESSYSLYDNSFFSNIGTILLYAVMGTLINVFTIGPSLFVLDKLGWLGGLDLGLLESLVFSSLISAVDPVAVLAIFQEVGVNKVLYFLVFGESLLNDAVTVVVYNMMVSFHGSEVTLQAILTGIAAFLSVSMGAVAIGGIFGFVTALVTLYTNEVRVVEPLAVIGLAYMAYLTAELVHFSGIIAIICCGLIQVQYAMNNISQKSYTTVKYFTKMMSAVCDTIIFIFLGMVLVNKKPEFRIEFIVWTTILCLVFRFMSVFGLTYCVNTAGRVLKINLEEQFIMAYGGLRGAVSFSLVIMLSPCKFPHYDIFVTTTLFIIIFTVFIQGASVKPLVNLLKIRRHQSLGDSLFTEINKKLVDNIMLGIEEVTGNRGGNYWKGVLSSLDEKYLRPLLVRDNGHNSLTRIYTKVVLADHYAHLYGPATALEEKLPLHVPRSLGEKALSLAAEDQISMSVPDENGQEVSTSEDEDRVLLRHEGRKKSVTVAAHANVSPKRVRFSRFVLMPRLTMSCNDAEQLRAASRSLDSEMSNNNHSMTAFGSPTRIGSDVGALSSDEKRQYTMGLWRKAVARASSLDSRPKTDTTKLLLKALNENPYHKYHHRYNPNLVNDDNQELAAHLRARRLRARRLTMYTLAGDVPSEPEQTDQDSLHGSSALPIQGYQPMSGGQKNTTESESDTETKGRRRTSSQGERRRSLRQRRKISTLTLGQVSHLDILRAAQQRRSSLLSRQSGSLSGPPTAGTTMPTGHAAFHAAVEKTDSGKESVQSSRPPSLRLSRQKAISSSQEDVLDTLRSPHASGSACATVASASSSSGGGDGDGGGSRSRQDSCTAPEAMSGMSTPTGERRSSLKSQDRNHSGEEDAEVRSRHHVVTIEDNGEDDKKTFEETSI
ncbi:uncharacterized protein LOC111248951 isoform X2 [Varroa destructor]|uniref:Sodium/hydrogen exchanger n=1 Tax=Varroa destructor TaxID=109461 RepID=A0A7M7JWD2_VARDE|nr:uncharacterized protein LOC111248951 isoform X2 [Varroa destructor]